VRTFAIVDVLASFGQKSENLRRNSRWNWVFRSAELLGLVVYVDGTRAAEDVDGAAPVQPCLDVRRKVDAGAVDVCPVAPAWSGSTISVASEFAACICAGSSFR